MEDSSTTYRSDDALLSDVREPLRPTTARKLHEGPSGSLRWLLGISLISVALVTINIGKASLWTDEVFSRYYYDIFGLHFLLHQGLTLEPTPPTYPILLKLWMLLFGDGAVAVRSLSAFAYVACLPGVYLLAAELAGKRVAILATLLFAVSPMGIYFAQEARVYALTLLPSCLLLWATAELLRDARSRRAALTYVAAATMCLYLHATLLFLVVSCGSAGCVWTLLQRPPRLWRDILLWCGLTAAALACSLPYTSHLVTASHTGGLEWIPPLHVGSIPSALTVLTTGMLTPRPLPGVILAVLALGSLAASVLVRPPPGRLLVIGAVIPGLFLAIVTAVSFLQPILLPRILCWAIIPLALLSARQMLNAGWWGVAVAATALLSVSAGLVAQETTPYGGKEPWRQVFAELLPRYDPSDLVVLSPRFDPLIPGYNNAPFKDMRIWNAGLPDTIMTRVAETLRIPSITRGEIERQIATGRTVWLISNGPDLPYVDLMKGTVPAQYDAKWPCGRTVCIEVAGWTPRPSSSSPRLANFRGLSGVSAPR